jgi:Fic family protein
MLATVGDHSPAPLRDFSGLTAEVAAELRRVDDAVARYRRELGAGGIAANSVNALRLELTYHSNAIEGNTLSLRETRLMLNSALLRQGYPLTVIAVERRAVYLDALERANVGACAPFGAFVAGSVVESIGRLIGEG